MGERTKKWERRSEARPAELIAAALQCFAERGFAATRLDDVAARAGVSKASVYLYFESKEKLFEAVVRAAVTPSLDRATALVDAFEGATPDLVRMLLFVFESVLDSPFPAIAKLVISESGNFPELARTWADLVLRRGMSLVQRVIERGVERKEFRPVDPKAAMPLVVAPVVLLAIWKHSFGQHTDIKLDPHTILAEHAETLLRGLAATDGNARKERNA
ncbi:MAG TPA: TetR/AcrR family transcriptional regulator [Polyangiaceae bacterium]|jgi:AcrR family transcriptional regulator